jgi:hypothetical protein
LVPQFKPQPQALQPVPGAGLAPRLFQQSIEETPTAVKQTPAAERTLAQKLKSRAKDLRAQATSWMSSRFAPKPMTPPGGFSPMAPQMGTRLFKGQVEEEKLPQDQSSDQKDSDK